MPVRRPVGQIALREMLSLRVPEPAVQSYIAASARRTEVQPTRTVETYPEVYAPDESIVGHLRFALKHEPIDMGVLVASLRATDPSELAAWVHGEPTGAFARRAWFLYETFTGLQLDLPPVRAGSYVDALDPSRHVVGARRKSQRHRVVDNLLGGAGMCLTVRRTASISEWLDARLDDEARSLTAMHEPAVLARAVDYLFTKETRSSFALEGEAPPVDRAARFVTALKATAAFEPFDPASFAKLQSMIVDPRYAASGWRTRQNFIGETIGGWREKVHFICPKPDDVPGLMSSWMDALRRMLEDQVHPVVAAAAASFAFVFVHPFEDGNGRIHRFLVHHVLARRRFTPPAIIFPVSVSILRDRPRYDAALESFSAPLFEHIDWRRTEDDEIVVMNATDHLYRYFDATTLVEYLFERVADTVRHDLKEELEFVNVYDRALSAVTGRIDMPDRRASLFVRLCLQNSGRLAKGKRGQFVELSDEEIEGLEQAVRAAMPSAAKPDAPQVIVSPPSTSTQRPVK